MRIPKPSSAAAIRVYLNRVGRKVPKIERNFAGAAITLGEILNHPEKYVLISGPSMIAADFESAVPIATLGVYSMWSGYLTKPDWVAVRDVIQKAPGDFVECHASGHISVPDIKKFVAGVNPARILPIHTAFPAEFRHTFKGAIMAADGKIIEI